MQAEEELNFAKEQQQQQLRSGHGNAQQTFQRQLQQGVAQVSEVRICLHGLDDISGS